MLLALSTSFLATFILTYLLKDRLPKDGGRAFAHDGTKSAGKARGAGIIFILVFALCAIIFTSKKYEYILYVLLVVAGMFTGFFDDASEKPWGELRKGLLDLFIAVCVTSNYIYNHGTAIKLALFNIDITLPVWLFAILSIILIWTSINVTNCADGVDGLSATVSIITLLGIYFTIQKLNSGIEFAPQILIFISCLVAYLYFNSTPSILMMGDAGSRAMGLFIAIAILQTGAPILYIPLALVLALDGGLGLLKVSLIRTFKIYILKNTRTPLHDHVRKNLGWSNTQCVYRFTMFQLILCVIVYYLL